jgi:two-component system sensor histidine kinase UhpB
MQAAHDDRDITPGRIQAEVELALDEERRRIAGEIHDSVNAAVVLVRLHAEGIVKQAAAAGHAGIEKQARSIVETANQAYTAMRSLSHRLRPEVLDVLGLGGAIAAMVRDLDLAHPACRFTLERASPEPDLPPKVAMTAYRVAQEALSNSAKHAQADRVQVRLAAEPAPRCVRMTIVDNGRGFDPGRNAGGGLGLAGIRERVAACGGELTVDSDGSGTRITGF